MRRRCHRLRRAAMVAVSTTLFASGASAEGPAILGGDDLTNHGSRNAGTPGPPSGITVFETEPNGDATTADPIAIGDDYAGDFAIPPPLDSDFMSFAATGGESILVTLAPGPFTIASLTLYDTDGVTILATTFLATKGSATFVLPPVPGTYFLEFSDVGFATVSYTLLVRELLGGGELFDGWLYIQKALENIAPEVTIGNDGTVAVLGSTDSTASCCNAGAAYHFAVPLAATTTPLSGVVTFHDGSAAINQFFIDLINGTVNPAIIVTPGSGAPNSLDASEGAALAGNALEIANFVNAGGGLLSHGGSPSISYGWLTALLPGASAPGGCDSTTLTLTAEGIAVFPGLTNDDIQAGPCHNNFLDHGLPVLARDGSGPPSGITVFETEPNDDATTADPIAIGDDYAGDFAIPPPLDSDFMSFAAAGGESILVTLAPGPLFLASLTLYDTDGVTMLAATFVFAKGSATFVLPPVPGTYFLEMRDFGLGPVSYTLLVRELLGTGVDVIIGGAAIGLPGQITLSPGVGFNLPGTTHMLTANVVDAGNPLAGIDVTFEVISGPNAGAMGIDTTNAFGDAFFDYLSNGIIGLDVIRASFVDPDTETPISTTARKYWDTDCQPNGIPDTCDLDCFVLACAADFPDDCGTSQDCTGNGIPDECEPDCNFNEQADSCDIFFGTSQDCNDNGIPDECDIASGESTDFNDNGIPDECELEPAFEEPVTTEAAGGGNFEAVGDFDDNGTPDVAIIIPGETSTVPGVVQVFLNLGVDEAGIWLGLVATDPVPVGLSPSGIAVGLLDADALPDVAVTNAGEDTVSILINLGLDELDVWQGLEVFDTVPVGSNPSSITAADLTGDGIIDLAVTETETPLGLGSGSVHLPGLRRFVKEVLGTSGGGLVLFLTNDGNAGFSAGGTAPTGGVSPTGLSDPEDVDNDKRKDLVGINSTGLTPLAGGTTGNVFVLLGDAKGGFGPPLTFDVGENPTDVAVGDFDLDGFPDIAVTNGADGTVSVLLNQSIGAESGTGLFAVVDVLTVGSNPLAVDAADLDGDGDLDLAVVAEDPIFGPAVQILQNLLDPGDPLAPGLEGETTLAFGPPASFNIEADPQFIVSADLNGDGLVDLATVNVDDDEPMGGSVTGLVTDPEPIGLPVHLDIKPGSCPNSFNRTSNGYLPVALVGNKDLNVLLIDLTTIELTRSDGIGGSVAPNEGPPGPHSVFDDVATPFGDPAATDCACHALLGDGALDLMMKFHRPTLVSVLNLNNLPSGAFVLLKVRGNLLDGTPFEAHDCLRLVGNENSGPGRGLD